MRRRKQISQEKLTGNTELLKELVKDWSSGKLSSYSAMIVVAMTVAPEKPSDKCIKWAREHLKEILIERGEG